LSLCIADDLVVTELPEEDMERRSVRTAWIAALVASVPAIAFAQGTSGIAGVVKDATGAVIPGVTVEAASPSLIEKVRTVVTDGEGQYKIIDLVPGVYSVTFTLQGFSAVKREGIELTASFTATINGELHPGAVAETITVTGATPTVDLQNVVEERVLTRDVINAIPAGNKNVSSLAVLVPGVVTTSQDVGGTAYGSAAVAIHGGLTTEMQLLYDGMYFNNGAGTGGSYPSIALNDATIQEVSTETGGLSAESVTGAVRNNAIPKDGGNTFKGYFFGAFTDHSLQSSNLDGALRATGLQSVDTTSQVYDVDPAFGGPLVKDKLWFYGSERVWKTKYTIAGLFYNKSPVPWVYDPNLSQAAYEGDRDQNTSLRLTWQLSSRNKITIHPQYNQGTRDHFYSSSTARTNDPDAIVNYYVKPSGYGMMTWTSPVTSRLLLEAGTAFGSKDFQEHFQPNIGPLPYSYRDLGTGYTWGNVATANGNNASHNWIQKFTTSYVTGSNAAKFGFQLQHGRDWTTQENSGNDETLQLLNGVPRQVTVFDYSTPLVLTEVTRYNLGLWVQDQWTLRRLTVNVGERFDHLNAYVPPQYAGPGPQVPNRSLSFAEIDNVPNWKNFSPRLGVSYDVFGDGKTAVKATLSKYLANPYLTSYTRLANPNNALVTSATRTWTDLNGDFVPEANELGALSNSNFGNSTIATQYAPNVNTNRNGNWETSLAIQHELLPRVSVSAAYFRRSYSNITVTQNVAVGSADFSPYCVTAPVDPRLPGGGGNQICGFYDVNPDHFGKVQNVIQLAPQAQDVYDGVDITMSARLQGGVRIAGGVSDGRERYNSCYALNDLSLNFVGDPPLAGTVSGVTSPRTQAYCDVRPPFQPNVKFLAAVPLPWWGLQTSATIQSIPPPQITASETVTNAQIAPSLGRNLSAGAAGTVTLDLIPPGTMYGDRLNQTNLRVSKVFRLAQARNIEAMVDIYNMFNANPGLALNTTYGSAWLRPLQVLQARLLKFGVQMNF
jgi:hypothetical protein